MRETILSTAAELIVQYGIKKFTIDEIASRLRISKKTIYHYFKSKDEIIESYITSCVLSDKESVLAAINQNISAPEKLKAVIHSSHTYPLPVQVADEIKQFYPEYNKQIDELKEFKTNVILDIGKQGISEKIFRSDINLQILGKMIQEVSKMFTDYPFFLGTGLKVTDSIDIVIDVLLHGIVKK